MHHKTWLTENRNLHSNVSTSQIRTVTLQQERAVRVFLTDEHDVDNISNNINLPSTFTSKQGNHHIPPPPPPTQCCFLVNEQSPGKHHLPNQHCIRGRGGGRNNCDRIKKRETVREWFLQLFSVVIDRGREWEREVKF